MEGRGFGSRLGLFLSKTVLLTGIHPAQQRRNPVSYTHLDVYKRQVLHIGACAHLGGAAQKDTHLTGTDRQLPGVCHVRGTVSYTHLDVYKRQASRIGRRCASAGAGTGLYGI